jgi:hypothetical protein
MKPIIHRLVAGSLALAGSGVAAQDSVIVIGGSGSFGSNGSSNPGTLSDGITRASARLVFHWDDTASELTVTVSNDSPILAGVPTPVLTNVFFNVPPGINGLSLVSQVGSGATAPSWSSSFDDDLDAGPNPNVASGFGAFNAALSIAGPQGGISNPVAPLLAIAPGTEVCGPATFVFAATGKLGGITAYDFNSVASQNAGAPGFVGAVNFQGGGVAAATGYVSPTGGACSTAATAIDLGGGCGGAQLTTGLPIMGTLVPVEITGVPPGACGTGFASPPGATPFMYRTCLVFLDRSPNSLFVIQSFKPAPTGEVGCNFRTPSFQESPTCCGVSFVMQGLIVDPSAPAGERISVTNGWQITLGS